MWGRWMLIILACIKGLYIKFLLVRVNNPHLKRKCIIWVTGKRYFSKMSNSIHQAYGVADSHIRMYPYLDTTSMALAYAATDLVIARAGALSIAELCVVGKAAIVVPSPHVANDHQVKNSLPLSRLGAAIVISDEACDHVLLSNIFTLLDNPVMQMELITKMRGWGSIHGCATDSIINETARLAEK